ncbi:phiSA1p31-related protein [Streptomyces albidoflavus]
MAKFKVGDKVTALGRAGEIVYGPAETNFGCPTAYGVTIDGSDWIFLESALVIRAKFDIGDQVVWSNEDGVHTVVAGPFRGYAGEQFYVVEDADGEHDTADAESLTLALAGPEPTTGIQVGDRVRVLRAKWVEEQHGKVGTVLSVTETFRDRENDLHPYDIELDDGGTIYAAEVEPVPTTVTYDGVEYSLTAEYRDNEGDFWKLVEGQTEEGGNARLHYRGKFSGSYAAGTDALSYVVNTYGPLTAI